MIFERTTQAIEAMINRGIARSSTAAAHCEVLDGRCLVARIEPAGPTVTLTAHSGRVHVTAGAAEDADVRISGTPLALLQLVGSDPQNAFRRGELAIDGDGETAEAFRELLDLAGPDVEEELAQIIGDPAAHYLGEAARQLVGWRQRSAASLSRSLAEYLQQESRDLPSPTELGEFLAGVDAVAMDVDRAEARLKRLRQQSGPAAE